MLDVNEAGERYVLHVERFRRRKRSTVQDYRIIVRKHLGPFFAGRSLDSIDRRQVHAYQEAKLAAGLKPKTVANHVRLLHGIFRYASGQEWVPRNPVAGIEQRTRGRARSTRRLLLPRLTAGKRHTVGRPERDLLAVGPCLAQTLRSRHMATDITQRELRNNAAAMLRRVAAGERLRITVHGHPVAELVSIDHARQFVPFDQVVNGLRGLMRADDRIERELSEMDEHPRDLSA